jgi:excisionase family DNA binding protein
MNRNKTRIAENHSLSSEKTIFEKSIWMTVKDTAEYLSRTENAVRILICRKVLRPYHLGRTVYLKKSEIDALIESSILNGDY